ncbi:hypothetical protein GTX14_27290, partial [Streptomyces sp. SID4944]|nr:hypothetical protein [Streptomyces sp. SID4944]
MPFEDELSEQLRRTGATFDLTARTAVVDGALARGQRSLRRRRGAAVAGSVLALALVGGGGALAPDCWAVAPEGYGRGRRRAGGGHADERPRRGLPRRRGTGTRGRG